MDADQTRSDLAKLRAGTMAMHGQHRPVACQPWVAPFLAGAGCMAAGTALAALLLKALGA